MLSAHARTLFEGATSAGLGFCAAHAQAFCRRTRAHFALDLGFAKEAGGTLLKNHRPNLLATAELLPTLAALYWRLTQTGPTTQTIRLRHALH